jgi:hypothetical protein
MVLRPFPKGLFDIQVSIVTGLREMHSMNVCIHCANCEYTTGGKCCGCTKTDFMLACVYCSLHNNEALPDPACINELTNHAVKSRLTKRKSMPVIPPLSFSPSREFAFRWSQSSPVRSFESPRSDSPASSASNSPASGRRRRKGSDSCK